MYKRQVSNGSDDDPASDGVTVPHSGAAFGTLAIEPDRAPFLRVGASGQYNMDQALEGQLQGARSIESGFHVAYTKERPEIIAEVIAVRHKDAINDGAGNGDQVTAKHAETANTVDQSAHQAGGHTGGNGDIHLSGGGYLQVAWRLRAADERFKPYARYEQVTIHEHDASLAGMSDVSLMLAGLRTDLTPSVALKLESIIDTQNPSEDWTAQAQLSAAW